MGHYRTDGLSSISSFDDWRRQLRVACGNPYEREDARRYLWELKQGTQSFDEYHFLFEQKRAKSQMEDASLIDCMRQNVNYSTQSNAITWRMPGTNLSPVSYADHVKMWSEVDRSTRQIKHYLPKQVNSSSANSSNSSSKKNNAPAPAPAAAAITTTTYANVAKAPKPASAAAPLAFAPVPAGDPMDLSTAMAAVKGRSTKVDRVKDICDKWNLCYYCKGNHPRTPGEKCPQSKKPITSSEMVLYEPPLATASTSTPVTAENA